MSHRRKAIEIGDEVVCLVPFYSGVEYGAVRTVLATNLDGTLIHLENKLSPYGSSDYKTENFALHRKGTNDMAYEKTKYFAMKMGDNREAFELLPDTATALRDSAPHVKRDIASVLVEGDAWIILQTIALIEGEPPRPPMKVTEYK